MWDKREKRWNNNFKFFSETILRRRVVGQPQKNDFVWFHTLKSMLIQEGINIDPILQSTGNSIGKSIFGVVYDDDLDVFMENIANYWQRKGLGRMTFKIGQIIQITTYDCFECKLLPRTGKPACFLDTGILEGLFSEFFNLRQLYIPCLKLKFCKLGGLGKFFSKSCQLNSLEY